MSAAIYLLKIKPQPKVYKRIFSREYPYGSPINGKLYPCRRNLWISLEEKIDFLHIFASIVVAH
jgi:hypothetical protein